MELDDKLCYCFHISKRKVVNFIKIHQPRVASQVSECGGAGTGCGWCVPFVKNCFNEIMRPEEANTAGDLSAEQYAQQRGEYIKDGKGTPPAGAEPPPE